MVGFLPIVSRFCRNKYVLPRATESLSTRGRLFEFDDEPGIFDFTANDVLGWDTLDKRRCIIDILRVSNVRDRFCAMHARYD